ncbi:nucleotidyltransferase domain-containing protein [Thermofilum pendens]|uniref:DNA polymerase, beta domain protein region n=1 Tax=Thermofilum pendens (strain DSM 2475 / Hrk 5) TaxID=368408 RepID=A1RZR9_THEPD|nr:nucleotidyltransferase domain-containing protein [Thermofilum pendens]ABL78699.1 DNA polymerase, beta domain protein region [Thermofilum pendens Hrk 5]
MSRGSALRFLRDYRAVAGLVKEVARRFDPEARVFVFGSAVRGDYTAASDIDVLVVTSAVDRKYDLMVEVYRSTEAPVELHVASPEQFEKWYKRFIPPSELVEV